MDITLYVCKPECTCKLRSATPPGTSAVSYHRRIQICRGKGTIYCADQCQSHFVASTAPQGVGDVLQIPEGIDPVLGTEQSNLDGHNILIEHKRHEGRCRRLISKGWKKGMGLKEPRKLTLVHGRGDSTICCLISQSLVIQFIQYHEGPIA